MLHAPTPRLKVVLDWLGIALFTIAISALVRAVSRAGTTYASGSWQILALGAAAVAALVLFVVVEKRATEQLLPMTVFTGHRNFLLAMAASSPPARSRSGRACCQMAGTIFQNSVSLRDMGAAGSSINFCRTLGGSLGVAVFGSLCTRALQGQAPGSSDRLLPAVATGTSHIFLTAALASLFVIDVPLKAAGPAPAADPDETTATATDTAA
ncbi:hypothetical protein ACFVGY_14570 [Streptomyces sp. NPDC127106]|uniref:hypothetical protein n=1 Tax=Streptomyces sp. NPDC127106 TaxID=3345360 RepID=UPI00363D0472